MPDFLLPGKMFEGNDYDDYVTLDWSDKDLSDSKLSFNCTGMDVNQIMVKHCPVTDTLCVYAGTPDRGAQMFAHATISVSDDFDPNSLELSMIAKDGNEVSFRMNEAMYVSLDGGTQVNSTLAVKAPLPSLD